MFEGRRSAVVVCFVILVLAVSFVSLADLIRGARALTPYYSGSPAPDEQLVLEYINRARANPTAEGQRLGIDITEGLQDDPSNGCYGPEYVGVRPPLAMNPDLLAVAEGHSDDMYNQNYFSHTDPNGTTAFQRIENSGYDYISAGENIGAGTGMSATDLEDTLMVDSGYPCRAHRMNLLDIFPYPPPAYYEIGIGYYEGPSGQAFITQDFGTSVNIVPLLTGVVFNDAEGSGFYNIGEGISGVTITPSSGDYYAITSSSGGYAFPIPSSGTITVTASGNGFGPISKTITLSGMNVELDFTSQGGSFTTASETETQTTSQTSTTQLYQTTQTTSSATTPPLLESVTFRSSPTDFIGATSPASITACGNTYAYFQSSSACTANFGVTANLPNPASVWAFDHWAWADGVACSNSTSNPTDCTASNSGGLLTAVYAARVNVVTSPYSSASVNWNSCSAPGIDNGGSFFSADFGNSTVSACNIPSGYKFSSWTCTGGLACQPTTNPTSVTFAGPGAIILNLEQEQASNTTVNLEQPTNSTTTVTSFPTTSALVTTTAVYTLVTTVSSENMMTTESTAPVSSQTALPQTPIPGFPWESILAGIVLGMLVLAWARRRD